MSLFLQLLAAFSFPFYTENLLSSMCVSKLRGKKLVSTTVKFSVLETLLLPIVCVMSVGLIETWSSLEKLCLGLGGQAFVAAWRVFFWASSVAFPVIIVQPHRIEEINEYVGGEEVVNGYLPFCGNTKRKARDNVQGEGQVSVFLKHTL